jgi:AraC-like DNA-binding protein
MPTVCIEILPVVKLRTRHKMHYMRQELIRVYDPGRSLSISTLSHEYPSQYQVPEHAHGSAQLIYAVRGVMEVSSGPSFWLLPPLFALWMPPRTVHKINMPVAVSMRTLYLRPQLCRRINSGCAVLSVQPLLRELILETVRAGGLSLKSRLHCAIRDVLIWELERASPIGTSITLPKDPRALVLANMLVANPGLRRPLRELCADIGASVRTIQRAFQQEVAISFESWRQQLRLMKTIELLAAGHSLKEAAFQVGYERSSTLGTIFRKTLGMTCRDWLAKLSQSGDQASICCAGGFDARQQGFRTTLKRCETDFIKRPKVGPTRLAFSD